MANSDKESKMKSRAETKPGSSETPVPNEAPKRYPTIDQIVEEWAGVFEPEFWDEVEKARHGYPALRRGEQK
jgi:hypothetical protein